MFLVLRLVWALLQASNPSKQSVQQLTDDKCDSEQKLHALRARCAVTIGTNRAWQLVLRITSAHLPPSLA